MGGPDAVTGVLVRRDKSPPYDVGSRDWGDASMWQGVPRMAGNTRH